MSYSPEVEQKEKVRVGAKLLDKMIPDWHKKLDPAELKMEDSYMCVLGQLFGRDVELNLAKEMFPDEWEEELRYQSGYYIGHRFLHEKHRRKQIELKELFFMLDACSSASELKCFWLQEIKARLDREESQ